MWVSPFRHPRIKGYLLLPVAFRSLSRLSSALSAKASALCPFCLTFAPIALRAPASSSFSVKTSVSMSSYSTFTFFKDSLIYHRYTRFHVCSFQGAGICVQLGKSNAGKPAFRSVCIFPDAWHGLPSTSEHLFTRFAYRFLLS